MIVEVVSLSCFALALWYYKVITLADPINKFSVISYPADATAARLPADPSDPPPPSGPHALHRALRAEGRFEEDESGDGP